MAIKVSINPLNTAAAISMGVTDSDTDDPSDPPDIAADIKTGNVTTAAAKVVSVNKAIAKAFNIVDDSGEGVDISISTAQSVVAADGGAEASNAYGRALAIVSQAEKASGKSTAEMTADVAKALNVGDGNLTGSKKPLDEGYADDAANAAAVQAAMTTGVASAQASAQMTQAQSSGVVKSMSASPITMVVEQIEGEGPDSYLNAAETAVSFVLSGSFAAGQKLQLFNGTTAIDFMMGDASVDGSVGHSFTAAAQEIIITVMKVDLTDNLHHLLKAQLTNSDGTESVFSNVLPIVVDSAAPTVEITSNAAALKIGETATITFKFSEVPAGFTVNDVVVSGGTLGPISGSGLTRTATFTPAKNSTTSASITVGTGYTDLAGNPGGAGTTPSITIDTVAPTVTITSDQSALKVGETAVITFTFSEVPAGFTVNDVVVSGGTLGTISGSGLTRTATFTPAEASTAPASIVVGAGYTDAAGNPGSAGTTPSITIDTIAPTITTTSLNAAENATAVGALVGSDTSGVTWTLAGTDADNSLFSITAGGELTLKEDKNFEAPGSATMSNAYTVKVVATDAAGNVTTKDITVNVTNVNEAPTVIKSITAQTAVLNQAAWTLNLSDYFDDVDAGDTRSFAITGGALPAGLSYSTTSGVISGTPTVEATSGSYTVTMTDSGGLSATQTFNLAVVSAPVVQSFTVIDTTTSNGSLLGKSGEELTFVVTLSEAVTSTGMLTAVFTVNGVDVIATSEAVTASDTLTFTGGTVPATVNGTSISLKSLTGAITGNVTNQPLQAFTADDITHAGYTVDNTAPTAPTIDLGAGVADGVTAAEAIASSGVVTVTADADASVVVTMTNSADNTKTLTKTVTGMGSAQAVTLTAQDLIALGDGTINVVAVATDAVGNASEAGTAIFRLDTTAPTVAITSDLNALKAGETAVITFTFTEAPVGFTAADLTVAGGALTDVTVNETDATIYTAMFTPDVNSTAAASITVSTGYTDAAGNTGGAGTTPTITIDTIAPTVAITSDVGALKIGETALITFTFTEAPTGFDAADLTVTGGSLGAITGTGLTRTATFTPAGNSTTPASITVSTGYTDAAGNTGGAGTTPSITIDTIAPTVSAIAITSADGVQNSRLNAGDVVSVTVTMSEAVTVANTPQLGLVIGTTPVFADYTSGTGTDRLTFTYTILASQEDTDGISISADALTLNGGTIVDAAGNAATLTHAEVANNGGFLVDTTAPTITTTALSVAENTTMVGNLVATDTNSVTWSFASTSADEGLFSIASDGTLTLNDAANFEARSSYAIDAIATDTAGNSSTQSIAVTVTDVNEAPTYVGASGNDSISIANGSDVNIDLQSLFNDPEGDTLTYTVGAGNPLPGTLVLSSTGGVISGTAARGTYDGIIINVSDNTLSVEHTFLLDVLM